MYEKIKKFLDVLITFECQKIFFSQGIIEVFLFFKRKIKK